MTVSSVATGYDGISLLAGNAAYDPAATFLIQRVAGTGSSGTITFSSIPQTYKHLQIRINARSTETGTPSISAFSRANGDTGSNYTRHAIEGDGGSVGLTGLANQTSLMLLRVSAADATANVMGTGIIDILDYSSTSKFKTFRSIAGTDNNGGGIIKLHSGLWRSTSAIDTLTIFLSSNNFTSTSTFALYGMVG
jgi:hypothetical protein